MEIITKKRYELEIVVEGESHTLCNALRKILMEDKDVKSAAYALEHPIVGEPKLYIKARSPKKALKSAAVTLKERCDEFKGLIEASE